MSKTVQSAMGFAKEIFTQLDAHWKGAEEGILRPAYSDEETHGINLISAAASEMKMEAYQDLAGNAFFIYPGRNRALPVFMAGSHMDAVPKGGRYDGPAGIVGPLSAVRMLHTQGITPEQDTVVTAFRGEESAWFKKAYLGSAFACGNLDPSAFDLKRKFTGETLKAQMDTIGLDTSALMQKLNAGERLLPVEKIGSFIETHIEQGYTLNQSGNDLGIVTAIRGNTRCPDMITFYGIAAHSGSTPQLDRRDAAFGAMRFGTTLEDEFIKMQERYDMAFSAPEINTIDGSPTTIPKQCDVRLEVRSLDIEALKVVRDMMKDMAELIAQKRGLSLGDNVNNIVISKPAFLNTALAQRILQASEKLGISSSKMYSGAGHDAKVISEHVPTSMIFIAHGNEGLSHNPVEIMAPNKKDDPFDLKGSFCKAVQVNRAMMLEPTMRPISVGDMSFIDELQNNGAQPL